MFAHQTRFFAPISLPTAAKKIAHFFEWCKINLTSTIAYGSLVNKLKLSSHVCLKKSLPTGPGTLEGFTSAPKPDQMVSLGLEDTSRGKIQTGTTFGDNTVLLSLGVYTSSSLRSLTDTSHYFTVLPQYSTNTSILKINTDKIHFIIWPTFPYPYSCSKIHLLTYKHLL